MDQLCSKEEEMSKLRAVILEMATKERYVTLPFNPNDTNLNSDVELPRYNFMTLGNKIISRGLLQCSAKKTPSVLYLPHPLEHFQKFPLKNNDTETENSSMQEQEL